MKKLVEMMQLVAAMIVAFGVLLGAGATVYAMMDEQYQVATRGWVLSFFGSRNNFATLTTANININYYEKRKCQGHMLNETEHELLKQLYFFYKEVTKHTHRYHDWERPAICLDRGVPTDE